MQQQTQGMGSDHSVLTREKTIQTFKVQQDIQMDSMDEMLREGMQEPVTPEDQMQMMMKMMVQQAKSADKLFNETGVEEE
jgi:hypothetical protein